MQKGYIVTLNFTRNDLFSFQNSPRIEHCRILYTPRDVGDLWKFELEDRSQVFNLNPNCSCFVGIELENFGNV